MSRFVNQVAQTLQGWPTTAVSCCVRLGVHGTTGGLIMNDEDVAEPVAGRWALLRARLVGMMNGSATLSLAVGAGLVLLGYALPLLFPIATVVLGYQLLETLISAGFVGISGHAPALAALLLCAGMSVSLWRLRVALPGGEPILPAQAPALLAAVDQLRLSFQTPPITDVHLTETAQVRVQRVPRSGYPVLFRHVLVVGLPALQCLTTEQFQCALASALGGLSMVRADLAAWIVQMADTWRQYRTAVSGKRTPAALLYRAFLAVYLPLLDSLAQRLNTDYRLRCDRYALEIAGDDLVAQTLAAEVVMQRFLESQYWPTVRATAEHSATPDFKVFRNLETIFRRRVDAESVQVWLRDAMVGKWTSNEQEVGLKTRLQEIGHNAVHYRQTEQPSAALALLGASYQWIIDRCDARWAAEHHDEWSARHAKAQRQVERLEQLRERLQQEGLYGEDAIQYAALVKRHCTAQEALEAYEKILVLNPEDPRINYGVGKYLLSCRDPRGIGLLERAMRSDKRYVEPACRLIAGFGFERRAQVRGKVGGT